MVPLRGEISQSFRNFVNDFHGMLGDSKRKSMYSLPQFGRESFHAEALEGLAECISEAIQSVSVSFYRLTLHLIEALPYLFRSEFVVIQERNEVGDGPLEVDIVLPERVIGIDKQRLWGAVLGRSEHERSRRQKDEVTDRITVRSEVSSACSNVPPDLYLKTLVSFVFALALVLRLERALKTALSEAGQKLRSPPRRAEQQSHLAGVEQMVHSWVFRDAATYLIVQFFVGLGLSFVLAQVFRP